MWLDARHIFGDRAASDQSRSWEKRFPTILATCRRHGVDPVTQLIPVAPACHYASGGVATDLWGRSTVPGLYATGEVARSGVHGANRLASNSLLEGLVFSRRIAEVLPAELRASVAPVHDDRVPGVVAAEIRPDLQALMTEQAGVLRSADGLESALHGLSALADKGGEIGTSAWEATNLLTISAAMAEAARLREETRGSHWREDFPARDDQHWSGHVDIRLTPSGLEPTFLAAPPTDGGGP